MSDHVRDTRGKATPCLQALMSVWTLLPVQSTLPEAVPLLCHTCMLAAGHADSARHCCDGVPLYCVQQVGNPAAETRAEDLRRWWPVCGPVREAGLYERLQLRRPVPRRRPAVPVRHPAATKMWVSACSYVFILERKNRPARLVKLPGTQLFLFMPSQPASIDTQHIPIVMNRASSWG